MAHYNRDEILKDLKNHVTEVTFTKVDGTDRVMRCTLMNNMLPPRYDENHLDEMHKKKENLETIVVWDVVKKGWRSFRVDNVEWIQVLDNF